MRAIHPRWVLRPLAFAAALTAGAMIGVAPGYAAEFGPVPSIEADAATGEVLPGAHVYLPDLRLGTTTNEAGYFAVSSLPAQAYHVRFSFLGYQPQDTSLVAGFTTTSVRLAPAALPATPAGWRSCAWRSPGAS